MSRSGLGAVVVTMAFLGAASPAAARTYLNYGDGHVRYKPHRLVGAGSGVGGGVWSAKHLHWLHWGKRTARATGTLTYNTCEPMCASGNLKSVHARFRFARVRANCELYSSDAGGTIVEPRRIFTRARVTVSSWPPGERVWHTAPADGFLCDVPPG